MKERDEFNVPSIVGVSIAITETVEICELHDHCVIESERKRG